MLKRMKQFKDKLYFYIAEKNWGVRREYGPYVDNHLEEHEKTPWKHWWLLIRLNWHYRVMRKETRLINIIIKDNRQIKLPYLNGAESLISKRRNPLFFAKELIQYDLVSFDVFDTLILRPFAKPADLFMIIGGRLKCSDFLRIRREAEQKLRQKKFERDGTYEITLEEIYAEIELITGIPAEKGLETELKKEKDFCFANPYMKRIFKIIKEQGVKIIAISDMYLSQDKIAMLLESCGYTGFVKIYVSCDYKVSKRSGELYKIVKSDYAEGIRFIHIGDNSVSDIKSAEAAGFTARFYRGVNEIGNRYRADGMSELIGSFYMGLVNAHLHSGIKTYSPYYEYGFIYGGLYVLGYMNWVHKRAKEEGVEKLIFLSRDGDTYMKIYNMLFNDIPCEYFYWSRIACLKYTLRKNRAEYIKRIVTHRSIGTLKLSIGKVLKSMSLGFLVNGLVNYGLCAEDELNKNNSEQFKDFLFRNIGKIEKTYEEEKKILKAHIEQTLEGIKKVAIIDVGWVGSGPMGLKYLIEDEWQMDCKVFSWLAAARSFDPTESIYDITSNALEPYMFSRNYNRNIYDFHSKTNRNTNNIPFEMFTQAKIPTFAGFKDDGSMEFGIPEIENYAVIGKIQEGITDFCILYSSLAKNDSSLFNITGYDAYMPYRMIIRDLSFIKKQFSCFLFARNINGDVEEQRIETLEEIFKQAGV